MSFIIKDDKELDAINDEELEDVNAGLMSKGALAAIIGGSIAGAALLATAIGVPLAKKAKKDKAAKAKANADAAGAAPIAPAEVAKPTTPTTIPFEVENQENIFPEPTVYGHVEDCSFDDLAGED